MSTFLKHLPSQLYPIVLLSTLAGLTYMLQAALVPEAAKPDRRLTHDPDAIAENFEIRRLDEQGRLKYRINAPYIAHYPDDDSADLTQPRLIAYRQDGPPLTLTANRAKITASGDTVYLEENVEIIRTASARRPPLVARTPALTVEPNTGLAYTDQAMEITQGASWVKGIGARIDNNTARFELHSQVRGHHVASRVKP